MAEIHIQIAGDKRITRKLRSFGADLNGNLKRGMEAAGHVLLRNMRRKISGLGFSRNPARSSPYPGVKHGQMLRTLFSKVETVTGGPVLRVGPSVKYAVYQEFGANVTQTVSRKQHFYLGLTKGMWIPIGSTIRMKIPPRPFVGPTFRDEGEKALDMIERAIMKPLRR